MREIEKSELQKRIDLLASDPLEGPARDPWRIIASVLNDLVAIASGDARLIETQTLLQREGND